MMEEDRRKQQLLDKQKADRAAASANSSNSGRKDEPWLAEGIVVKASIVLPSHLHAIACLISRRFAARLQS